jgi:hypothetical protein
VYVRESIGSTPISSPVDIKGEEKKNHLNKILYIDNILYVRYPDLDLSGKEGRGRQGSNTL